MSVLTALPQVSLKRREDGFVIGKKIFEFFFPLSFLFTLLVELITDNPLPVAESRIKGNSNLNTSSAFS